MDMMDKTKYQLCKPSLDIPALLAAHNTIGLHQTSTNNENVTVLLAAVKSASIVCVYLR